jgi:hypothetical protein
MLGIVYIIVLRCISSPGSEGVTIIIIKQSPFDNNFRQIVADHIRNAKKTIKIVTGEISSYNYYDLRNAAEDAAERGVKVDVYATSPDRDIINRLIHNGINVFTGEEIPKEHFMIIDNKKVIISYKERDLKIPTPMGDRKGKLTDTLKEVKKYLLVFEKLKKEAIKESMSGEDPLQRILNTNSA